MKPVGLFPVFLLAPVLMALTAGNAAGLDPSTSRPESAVNQVPANDDTIPPFEFYGRINRGLLFYDDGVTIDGYFPIDNDSLSSKVGFRFHYPTGANVSVGGVFELSLKPYSTEYVSQIARTNASWDQFELRRAQLYLKSDALGSLWLGQGSMASDGSSETDLSGTYMIGYASVGDIANGQYFRTSDGAFSDVQIGDAFDDLDGLGRKLRVRYDTPDFGGITFSTSVGTQVVPDRVDGVLFDAVLTYNRTLSDFSVAGALAYSQSDADGTRIVNGSVSTLHNPSGISVTLAGGTLFGGNDDEFFVYGKLGYQKRFFELGKTAFSVDTYYGHAIAVDRSESFSLGLQFVQDVDAWDSKFYLGGRSYDYHDPQGGCRTGFAVMAGTLFEF